MKEIQILNNGDALYDIRRKINENFELMGQEVENGNNPLTKFGVNEGNETNGVADLIDITDNTLNFKVGGEYPNLVITSGDGVTTRIENVNPLYLQNLADGEYTVLVDGSNSTITDAEFYSQLLEPENPNAGDVWFNGENAVQHKSGVLNISLQESTPFKVNCIASSGNSVLIAGDNNSCARSSDAGKTWETFEMGEGQSNQSFVGCVFHNNTFYLITSGGSLYTSSNLEAWSSTTLSLDGFVVTNLILVNNILVVLTNSRYILVNHSGNTWTTRQVTTNKVNDIIYFNGEYYAISGVMLFTSQNLIDWTSPNKSYSNANCLGTYNNKLLIGSTEGKLYIDDFTGNLVTKQLKSGTINAIETRPDGYFVFVGSNGVCSISNDLQNFTNLDIGTTSLIRTDGEFAISSNSIIRISPIGSWVPYQYIPVGEVTISGGEITYFTTYPYNSNGLFDATSSSYGLLRTAAEPDELNCQCSDAVLTPSNLYSLQNFRLGNTEYNVDDKVGCPYHHNLQLNCTQAGTTAPEALNTKGHLEPGTVIEDGTVIWEVQELGTGGGGLEIGDIGVAPLGVDETAGKRRILNGQVIIQNQYVEFTNKVKTAVELYPSLACTEPEWQTTVTMSAFGTCGKFVIDDNAGTIRLPKITGFIQGLTDLNKLGEIVEAGLPNIEATSKSYMTGVVWDNDDLYTGAFYQIQRRTRNNTGTNSSTYDQVGFDASRSNPIYGNSNTVQPEAVQYPYFIQVATGASTQDNITNTIELNNPFFYGLSQYFESEPNNLSWLKSNGQWNSKAIHTDYYDWLLKIYNGVEVVEGVSVKLYSETYTDYDFVINTANETFRLPLLNGDETLNSATFQTLTPSNGLEVVAPRNGFYVLFGGGTSNAYVLLREKGSEYSSICYTVSTTNNARATLFVKKGTTVQVYYTTSTAQMQFCPAVGNGDLYYYVGETVQNANLINAGRIEEKLADKTDKVQASLASMPSGRYIELTAVSGQTYLAPANGWFTIAYHWNSYNQANWSGLFTIKDAEVGLTADNIITEAVSSQGGADNSFTLPVAKGQYAYPNYNTTTSPPSLVRFRFQYAQGEI